MVSHNVAPKIEKIKGNIAIVADTKDDIIPQEQITKNIDALPESEGNKIARLITTEKGHTGNWLDGSISENENAILQFDDFLARANLLRGLF